MTTFLLFLAVCVAFFAMLDKEIRSGIVGLWLGFVVFVFPIIVLVRIF